MVSCRGSHSTAKGTGQADERSAAGGHTFPPIRVLLHFRFIPPETVNHHMDHHLQRDQVVTRFLNLRKMVGCLVDRLKRMSTS